MKSATRFFWLETTDPCRTDPPSPVSISKNYPYDTYHDCDTTLVTLRSVLAHFLEGEEELYLLSRRGIVAAAEWLHLGVTKVRD